MENINTLQYFLDLKASKVPEDLAVKQAFALNNALNGVATKEDLNNLEKRIDSKLSTIEKIGGGFCITMTALLFKIAFWP